MNEDGNGNGNDKRPYRVGRGKPPAEHRFVKGQSGNALGRPRKASRSLTERQPIFDILKVASKKVKVRRGGAVVTTTVIESIWEGVAAKAASGHAPSQRFFLKEYRDALGQLRTIYPKFLRMIEGFENDAGEGEGVTKPRDQEFLEYVRRRTHQLIGAYDERKDPYIKKQKREYLARFAWLKEREAKGIKNAEVSVVDDAIMLTDPVSSRKLRIERGSYMSLAIALNHSMKVCSEDLHEHLVMSAFSYDEAVDFFRQNAVVFQEC